MATKPPLKISELTAVTEATDTSFVPISSETETNKITYSDLTKGLAKTTDLTAYEKTASLTTKLSLKADKTEVASTYATKTQLDSYLLKTDGTSTYALKAASYTKAESDAKFALKTALEALEARVLVLETP